MLELSILILTIVYGLGLLTLTIALVFYRPATTTQKPFVSVIVAARNERHHIARCVQALRSQDYDQTLYEIIVVDDRSEDETADIAEKAGATTVVRIAERSPVMAPKKHALNEGIKRSRGEILLFTDADCEPANAWISAMVSHFAGNVGLVVGFSPVEPREGIHPLDQFLALDSLGLAAMSASGSAIGLTMTATGRSLAYRRTVFDEVGGFSSIAQHLSGDDDLLLQLVRETRWQTVYCMNSQALVPTVPAASFKALIQQKTRQSSKSALYVPTIKAILSVVFLFNLLLISYVPLKYTLTGQLFALFPWAVKLVADFLLLAVAAVRLSKVPYLAWFPLVAPMYPFYVVGFALLGRFGNFEWKSTEGKAPQ